MGDPITDIVGAIGAGQASAQQQAQVQQALDLQRQIYGQNSANLSPWVQQGQQSLGQLAANVNSGAYTTSVNPQNLQNDPGYQFRMQQGQQALERSASAGGRLNSGGFMKGLDQYSQGLASQEYNQAWQRNFATNQQNYDNLYRLAGNGQNAAAGLGNLGQGYANSMSGLYGAMGNAQAAGTMGVYGGLGNAFGQDMNAGQQVLGFFGGGGTKSPQYASQVPSQFGSGASAASMGGSAFGSAGAADGAGALGVGDFAAGGAGAGAGGGIGNLGMLAALA